jgi:hypothetical protein
VVGHGELMTEAAKADASGLMLERIDVDVLAP